MIVNKQNSNKIIVLATGGTIAGAAAHPHDNIGYQAAQWGIEAVLASVPGWSDIAHTAGVQWQAEQVAQVDSKDINDEVWRTLALRCTAHLANPEVRALILTHGSDTLEETAWFLHCILGRWLQLARKSIILTCAMRPATALSPDGPQNLRDALTLAALPAPQRISGVMVIVAGTIHSAHAVQKVHPYRLDAFSSGESGSLGWVEEGQVRWAKESTLTAQGLAIAVEVGGEVVEAQNEAIALLTRCAAKDWPRVDVILSHAGADGRIVDALLTSASPSLGLVLAATGNGSIHQALEAALQRAHHAGVRVWVTSRCPQGQVLVQGNAPHPFEYALGLSPVKARISLLLKLLNQ